MHVATPVRVVGEARRCPILKMPHPAHDLCSSQPHRCVVVRVTSAMREHEEVLSLDLEESDYLYRIQCGKRVVYVSVLHADIVPPDHRTPAPTSWVGRGMAHADGQESRWGRGVLCQ